MGPWKCRRTSCIVSRSSSKPLIRFTYRASRSRSSGRRPDHGQGGPPPSTTSQRNSAVRYSSRTRWLGGGEEEKKKKKTRGGGRPPSGAAAVASPRPEAGTGDANAAREHPLAP